MQSTPPTAETTTETAAPPLNLDAAISDLPSLIEQNSPLIIDYTVRFAGVLILFLIGFALARWLSFLTMRALGRSRLDVTLTKFFGRLVRWLVMLAVALAALGILGIPTASFAVVIGAAGLAIGLAFQGTLSNFASGLMLLLFRPFKVGDVVNIAGIVGTVDEVQIFTTTIDTADNRRYIVPNSNIFGTTIENITYHPKRRVDVNVGTSYSADTDKVRAILEEAARHVKGRLETEDVVVWLDSLGDSAVQWQVRVWAPTSDWGAVKQALTRDIKAALDAAGVSIPFPQRDVHLVQPPAATA